MSRRLRHLLLTDDTARWLRPTDQTRRQHEPRRRNASQSESSFQNRRRPRYLCHPLATARSWALLNRPRALSATQRAQDDRYHPKSDRPLVRVRIQAVALLARKNRVVARSLEFESVAHHRVLVARHPNRAPPATRD